MRDRMEISAYAPSTIISYVRAVRDLMEHFKKLPQDCSENEVIAYLNELRQARRISPSALNCRIFGILFYYRQVVKALNIRLDIPNPFAKNPSCEPSLDLKSGSLRSCIRSSTPSCYPASSWQNLNAKEPWAVAADIPSRIALECFSLS
ncbi:MAG TPA: phage integrase N-terminal SAM-like domain-containing protein [Saprospiraceae bacterium]|nr:phage integrase N-terminal SAM-like domain-containing protein [Saprospiraceae bacterium]